MTGKKKSGDYLREGREDRLLRERVHDPYRSKRKLNEPTVCPDCGAVYHAGRWQWAPAPAGAETHLCPACQRIRDRVPAGFLELGGGFFEAHRDEILNLVRNLEAREQQEHPLKRIMDVEAQAAGVVVTTTDADLVRAMGDAVEQAYEGELDYEYTKEASILRVRWHRDG